VLEPWRQAYHHLLQFVSQEDLAQMPDRLKKYNPEAALLRSAIEAVWEPIDKEDNWEPFYQLIRQIHLG